MNPLNFDTRPTLLLVDDAPENLALMSNLLRNEYRVKVATSGEKALKIAASATPPDLILLDIMMPGMDGYEVCRQLKSNARTKNIPVIFLTAKVEMKDEQRGLELGAVDYITKPVSPPIVMARVKNHLALKKINNQLERATFVAEKANLAKTNFLSGMSHELRSPLNAILGFAQLMESDAQSPTSAQKDSITQILQAGWHLLKLINEILDLAKIESGHVPLQFQPVSLSEVMSECQSMLALQAQQHGIRMSFPEFATPCFVLADRTRVKQVLINLLSNAIKYNRQNGSIKVTLTTSGEGRTRVNIRDTGLGLAPEKMTQLFQAFNRLGQESGNQEGTGIGLVVALRLVELMEGRMGVESRVDVGSLFWFELDSGTGTETVTANTPTQALPPPHGTLLYVEDNPANMKLVEQIIARRPGFRLLTAVNALDGIDMARTFQPDVVLMDINLPGMSGIEALQILRTDKLTAHIPVMALSANAMPLDIETGMKSGFFRYLSKPIKIDEFTASLDVAVEFAGSHRKTDCA
ncbi:MAG: response regulator [Gallionella sp.]|jgi:CheY-like chemotaxis protein